MATYAKGYKKQASELLLLKVIVALIGVVLLAVGAAYVYAVVSDVGSYDDWTHVDYYDEVLALEDADGEALENYVVYFYSDTCTNCSSIETQALRLVKRINSDDEIVYFVNTDEIEEAEDGDKDSFLDAIELASVKTPMVVIVVGGEFYQAAVGTDDVIDVLTQIKKGTYEPFQ
jgi:thiol-disulfide isomerase/thioredoxin